MQVGAWYCSLWWQQPFPAHYFRGSVDWRNEFPLRQPLTGWYSDTQAIVDEEILLASQNGIDFFAFCWYGTPRTVNWPGSLENDNNGLRFFRTSQNKAAMRFCLSYVASPNYLITDTSAWSNAVAFWVDCFHDPQYLTVGHRQRPVFIIDSAVDFHSALYDAPSFLTFLRSQAQAAGLPNPMVGGCLSSPADVPQALADGFDFICGDYASPGHIPPEVVPIDYGTLLESIPPWWDSFAATGAKYLPVVCAGFDRRPIGLTQPEGYLTDVTPMTYRELLTAGKAFLSRSPNVGLLLNYAWNEIGEMPPLAPTLANGDELVRQIKEVFG